MLLWRPVREQLTQAGPPRVGKTLEYLQSFVTRRAPTPGAQARAHTSEPDLRGLPRGIQQIGPGN